MDAGLPPSGFGLTSMAERASLLGGRLRAGPTDGGFAVHLWLPLAPAGGAGGNQAAMTTIRVLVADDQKVVRDGLSPAFGMLPGVEVVGTAVDGEDAVRQAIAAPDVVLMDLHMPNCDGVEATRRIVRDQPSVRVVVLTAYSRR